jgi:hypothetical protein
LPTYEHHIDTCKQVVTLIKGSHGQTGDCHHVEIKIYA